MPKVVTNETADDDHNNNIITKSHELLIGEPVDNIE